MSLMAEIRTIADYNEELPYDALGDLTPIEYRSLHHPPPPGIGSSDCGRFTASISPALSRPADQKLIRTGTGRIAPFHSDEWTVMDGSVDSINPAVTWFKGRCPLVHAVHPINFSI